MPDGSINSVVALWVAMIQNAFMRLPVETYQSNQTAFFICKIVVNLIVKPQALHLEISVAC